MVPWSYSRAVALFEPIFATKVLEAIERGKR
jgi:hypothetical protein